MKLAISTYSLWRWRKEGGRTLEEAVDWIGGVGVEAVEFAGPVEEFRGGKLRRRAEKAGLEVAGYCVGAELLVPRGKQREVVERLKGEVEVAVELGCKTMRHDVTRGFGEWSKGVKAKTFEEVVKWVAPAIREVADYAGERGIVTSLENHGFYMQESRRVEKLIKGVGHGNFGLTLDMGNFLCVNEEPVDAVRRLAKYAVMAHAKDFHVRKKETMPASGWFATPTEIALRGAIAGHGVVDIPAELKLLKRAGYDGYLSLEFEGIEEPEKAVMMGIEYLKSELRRMKEDNGN